MTLYVPGGGRAGTWAIRVHAMRRSQPHYKPALLLCALDLLDGGEASVSAVPIAQLVASFRKHLSSVGLSNPDNAYMPARHLALGMGTAHPFWELRTSRGERLLKAPKTTAELLREARTLAFVPELWADLEDPIERFAARHAVYELLESDGKAESTRLLDAWSEDQQPIAERVRELEALSRGRFILIDAEAGFATASRESVVRSRAFRRLVLPAYEHRCALCGLRLRVGELAEVEAAHVCPRRLKGTDDPRNGLALCRTHHWAFDQFLWTIREQDRIEVRPERGAHDDLEGLRRFASVTFPANERWRPHAEALAWHRSQFQAARGA